MITATTSCYDSAAAAAGDHKSMSPSTKKQSLYANLPSAEIIESLPMETRFPVLHRQFGGFWKAEFLLKGMAAAAAAAADAADDDGGTCSEFEPDPSDIFLASLPKSGTTWLKALAFATLNRATHPPPPPSNSNHDGDGDGDGHPLKHRNPHDCVSFLELMMSQQHGHAAAAAGAPRLIATHLPCSWLPPAITAEGSPCRIVYVCREPKDVLVSYWNFSVKAAAKFAAAAAAAGGGQGDRQDPAPPPPPPPPPAASFEEAFELFCEGRYPGGPHWLHALEYWEESRRRPHQVLFLRYEELLRDPAGNLRKLAAFMGCPFSEEEEKVVDHIVELCSLDNLRGMDVNRNGTTLLGVGNDAFFRKGQEGDWKNYMTPEMAARLDKVVEEATRGSGLIFNNSYGHTSG